MPDPEWYEKDRMHLEDLLQGGQDAKEEILREYEILAERLARLYEGRVEGGGRRGYTLLSPDLTEAVNSIWLAMTERAAILRDYAEGAAPLPQEPLDYCYINTPKVSYPKNILKPTRETKPFAITPTKTFHGYNENLI